MYSFGGAGYSVFLIPYIVLYYVCFVYSVKFVDLVDSAYSVDSARYVYDVYSDCFVYLYYFT